MKNNQSPDSKKIDFLVIGTQKSGTTALDYFLRQNPTIQMPLKKKELHFFDNDSFDWRSPCYENYHSQFDWSSSNVIRGEVTPIYMYWPSSIERIKAYSPNLKLICILRNPCFRAYSHWRMECARNMEYLSFSDAIRSGRERLKTEHKSLRTHDYVERGFYAHQVQRLLEHFDRQQMLFITSDAFQQSFLTTLNQIAHFIKSEPFADIHPEYISVIESNQNNEISTHDHTFLLDIYKEDISKTMQLTGLDLCDWLKNNYQEIGTLQKT